MRIAHIGKYYSPTHGGMERVVRELCEGLVERGHAVRAIVASETGRGSREWLNQVDVVCLKTRGRVFSQPLVSGIREAIEEFEPDLVHFHLPNPLALLMCRSLGVPTCATLHADAGGFKRPLNRALTMPYLTNANAVIFSSFQMAQKFRQELGSDRTKVIPFGFRFDYLRGTGLARDARLILFVGRLVSYKGLDVLVRALPRVDARLVIVGDGPQLNSLKELARRLGVRDRIEFLGSVTDEDLGLWYERCGIYVQPSISECEAFGISMLEAMHMARPVISTDLATGVREVNLHGETGLIVPPKNPLSLASALNTLLRDPELALRLGENARRHSRTFAFQAMIDRHANLYREIAGPKDRRAVFNSPSPEIH